jgi:hypothetical protein
VEHGVQGEGSGARGAALCEFRGGAKKPSRTLDFACNIPVQF